MDVKEYQSIIQKTAIYPREVAIPYCTMGLTGEAGEVADKIKKLYRDTPETIKAIEKGDVKDDMLPDIVETRQAIKKELGDVIWYVTALASEFKLTLEEILEANYEKLIKRRETNTLHGSGDDREDDKK